MTVPFVFALISYALVTLVPGFLLLRTLNISRTWSACLAPLPSIGLLCLAGQLYATLGIAANPVLMLGLPCIIIAVCFLVIGRNLPPVELPKIPWWMPLVYVGIGTVLSYDIFLSKLVTNDTVIQAFDLTQAINSIRSFANAGRFSSLGIDYFLEDPSLNPFPGKIFYPASWHMLCALVVQMTDASAALVINVSEFASMSFIFPLGMCAVMASISDGDPVVEACGALVCHAFVIFPWVFLIFGPIYPNMAAFSAMPGAVALFVNLAARRHDRHERIMLLAAFLVSGIGLGLLHPNAVFAAAVILIPYCVYRVAEETSERYDGRLAPILAGAGMLALCMAIWYGCFRLPFFRAIVGESWGTFTTEWQELVNIATLSYIYGYWYEFAAQLPLAFMVLAGAIWCLHRPRFRWPVFSYGFACLIMLFCATREGTLKQVLAGFWYSDHIRVAGLCSICAMPLAAFGMRWCYEQVLRVIRHYNGANRATDVRKVTVACICLFLLFNYLPEFNMPGSYFNVVLNEGENDDVPIEEFFTYSEGRKRFVGRKYHSVHTPFGDVRTAIIRKTISELPLSDREKVFLKHVAQTVGPDAIVINNPMDGSFLGYGMQNIRCYYRTFVNRGFKEKPESTLIRTDLVNIATNPEVRAAVDSIGAEYVMVLSEYKSANSFINLRGYYSAKPYAGISSITEDTPGFELVMQEYELKLYRILPEQE